MSPLLFYEMVKDNIKGTDLEKNFLPLAGLLGIGSDDGANANSMAYGLIPLFFNNNFQSTDFNQLFTNPGFMNMLNTPVNNGEFLFWFTLSLTYLSRALLGSLLTTMGSAGPVQSTERTVYHAYDAAHSSKRPSR